MRVVFVALFYLFISTGVFAQVKMGSPTADESQLLKSTITNFFDAFHKGDTVQLKQVCDREMVLNTFFAKEEKIEKRSETFAQFLKAIAAPRAGIWEEKLLSWKINYDEFYASVWTEYEFYFDAKFSHCGINAFELMKSPSGWKIISIKDTRRKSCLSPQQRGTAQEQLKPLEFQLNALLDSWHMAAATANLSAFFSTMSDDFIYLGTDKTERWTKDEFYKFCQPHFEKKGGGWNFKPNNRVLYFNADYSMAWFEELLDTWMGVCRGSGVLELNHGKWKLKHYNLAVTIDNDKIKSFIELTK